MLANKSPMELSRLWIAPDLILIFYQVGA